MYSKDLKKRAIDMYNKFKNYRLVEKLLNIGKSTIHRWVNNIYFKKPTKDITNIIKYIKSLLHSNNYLTIKQVKDNVNEKFKCVYSKSFIYNIITNKLNYSYKKVSKKIYSKNINNLIKLQKKFKKSIKNYNNIIAIDETYMYSNNSPNYGWAIRGKPLIKFIKSNPVKYSIIMAISNNKIIDYKLSSKNIETNSFYAFMTKLNDIFKNKIFLMDNVRFHKSKRIIDLFKNSNNRLLFIPPYSPQLNPIEEVFSHIKRSLNRTSTESIIKSFKKSIRLIKKQHLENYYKHSFSK